MESFRLDSRIIEDEREFLIQTVNDSHEGTIKTSLFINGELLDTSILPHSEEMGEEAVLSLVKNTHGEKRSELEYLLKSYKQVLQEGQSDMMYHLGTALFFKRMYPQARALFGAAIRLRPDYHEACHFMAQTELALNHLDGAVKAALRAVELRATFADYRNILGEAYLAEGSCKRAVIEFEEAIRLNIYYADAYFNLAMTYILNALNKEDFSLYADLTGKTRDLLEKALLIQPAFRIQAYDEALQALESKDLKKSYLLLKSARDTRREKARREKACHFNRFLIFTDWVSQSNVEERIDILEREIDRNPGYVDLYYELGVCYLQRARLDWQKGSEYFKKALEINPRLGKAQKSWEIAQEHYLKLVDTVADITNHRS